MEVFSRWNDASFLRGKRNKKGELVIRKMSVMDAVVLFFPQVCISGLFIINGLINSPDNPKYVMFFWLVVFLFVFAILEILLYKVTFTHKSIVFYGINGECRIDYQDIKNIKYSERGGGKFIIRSDNKKIVLRVKVRGMAEAIELLQSHIGEVVCEEANAILSNRKRELGRG